MIAVRFSGDVEEVDSEECDNETAEQGQSVGAIGGIKPLEKDQGSHNRRARESNIVHRVYTMQKISSGIRDGTEDVHIRGECVQGLIKVVHLDHYTHGGHNAKYIGARVCELIVPSKGEFHRNAKALDRHDRYRADQGADGDVDDRVCAPIPRGDGEDHEYAEYSDGEAIQHEACSGYVVGAELHWGQNFSPGWRAKWRTSSTVAISLSSGAWRTMINDPSKHSVHPTLPM